MKGKNSVIKNKLWLRKYWFSKSSRMKYEYRYKCHDGIFGNPLTEK